jgi:hypothetical protein
MAPTSTVVIQRISFTPYRSGGLVQTSTTLYKIRWRRAKLAKNLLRVFGRPLSLLDDRVPLRAGL